MSESPYEYLARSQREVHRDVFASRPSYVVVKIDSLDVDGLGNVAVARGQIDDQSGFPINVAGRAVEVGEYIVASYPADAPAGSPLLYVAHYSSDNPGAGIVRKRSGPAPSFASGTWHTERIESLDNAIMARITIYFEIELKYQPSKVYIVHKPSSQANYTDQAVPFLNVAGVQQAEIAVPYKSGTSVDIALRAEYQYAYGPSERSAVRTVVTPADTTTPGAAAALAVSVAVSGQIRLEASGTVDRSRFVGWRYEIATSPTGPPIVTATVDGPYTYFAAAGGTYYVAVAPIGIANNLGTRYPSNTITVFSGPYVVSVASTPPDITAPGAWAAPTLAGRTLVKADGSKEGYLKVTFPAHFFEPDYSRTKVRLYNGTIYDEWTIDYRGSAPDPLERQVDFGAWTVWLYAIDTSDNKSALSTSASVTITAPGAPGTAASPTTDQLGLAVAVNFTMPADAEIMEVQRATDAAGTGATTIAQVKGTRWLDVRTDQTVFPVTYYYRVRGRNSSGDGAFSAWIAGTLNRIDGTVLSANTINGDRVIASTLDANTIKTNTILSALIKTAASANRWEIEGHTGGASQDQIRMYDATSLRVILYGAGLNLYQVNGASIRASFLEDGMRLYGDAALGAPIRMFLNTDGLTFYNNAGAWVVRTGISSGVGYMETAGGFQMRGDFTLMDLSSTQYMRWSWVQAGNDYQHTWLRRMISGGINTGTGLIGYKVTPGGTVPHRFFIGYTGVPLDATTNYTDANVCEFQGGIFRAGAHVISDDGTIYFGTYDMRSMNGAYGAGFDTNNRAFQARDIYAIRDGGVTGVVFLGNQSGGARYLYFDSVNYVMAGTAGTPALYVSGINVSSSEILKKDIRPIGGSMIDLVKKIETFRYKGIGQAANTPDQFGFVAEQVEGHLPRAIGAAAHELPSDDPNAPEPEKIKAVNIVTLLTVLFQAVKEHIGEYEADRDTFAARLDKIEQKMA